MYTLMVTFVFVSRQLKHLRWNCEVPFLCRPNENWRFTTQKYSPSKNLYPLLSFWWLETVQTASFSWDLPLADFSPQWQHDFYECNHQQTCNPNSPREISTRDLRNGCVLWISASLSIFRSDTSNSVAMDVKKLKLSQRLARRMWISIACNWVT